MSSVDPRLMANAIRFLSMDAIEHVGEGHPGTPLGAADTVTALFTRHLKFNAADPLWFDRDRFVQSNGHGSMLIYSLLHLSGYGKITLDEIKRFRMLGSHCAGHPEIDQACGIEVTTGLLGQGIANAAGLALAEAFLNQWFGPGIVDHHTYALVGDGCLQEGVGQEVISLAGHLRHGKLTFLWDHRRCREPCGRRSLAPLPQRAVLRQRRATQGPVPRGCRSRPRRAGPAMSSGNPPPSACGLATARWRPISEDGGWDTTSARVGTERHPPALIGTSDASPGPAAGGPRLI